MEPSPCRELVNCGVEIMLDKEMDDRYPIEPSPCRELVSCGDETRFGGNMTVGIFKLLNKEPSPTKRLLLIVVPYIIPESISSVLTTTALIAPKSAHPVPSPNVRTSTLNEEI